MMTHTIALMMYCSIPLHSGFSSSKLLMNRRIRTTLPILESQLQPSISEYSVVCEKEAMRKANSKKIFDIRHSQSKQLLQIHCFQDNKCGCRGEEIVEKLLNNHNLQDHNYILSSPMGEMRWNRQHLTQILNSENSDSRPEQTPQQQ